MLKRVNKISVKYAIAFICVAVAMVAVVAVDMLLVTSLKDRLTEFGHSFHQANTAILNGDRDLYQAHVATVEYLRAEPGTETAAAHYAAYQENAQQAYDRMHKFGTLLAGYPTIQAELAEFETRFTTWRTASEKVFDLRNRGLDRAAANQLEGPTLQTFSSLRDIYDQAGAAADTRIREIETSAIARANRQEVGVIAFSVLVCIATLIVALAGPLMMSRAIQQVTTRIREITEGDGDLTARIVTQRGDEIGDLATNFNSFIGRIDDTFQSVRRSTESVHNAANEIAEGSQSLSARTEQSAANLEETSASMEQITATVSNTAEAADQADALARTTMDAAHEGERAMSQMRSTMDEINTSATQISDITNLIDGIAFQTNLLALNASVEAARAGEHGRGFSVVAQEVRALASRASDASRDIRELIDTSMARTRSGTDLVHETSDTIQEIVKRIERVTEVVGTISTGAREQSQGVSQINVAVNDLDSATQHNAALVEQTSAAAIHMRDQAEQLRALIASFRLSSDVAANAGAPNDAETAPRTDARPALSGPALA